MPMTRRSTPGVSGPRSTRSPTKTAVRPSGCVAPTAGRGRRTSRSQPSSVSRVRSSEAQPWTSPMMSNGPVSSRAVVPRTLARRRSPASISSSPRSTWTRRKPSLLSRRASRLQVAVLAGDDVAAEVAVGPLRVALDARRPRGRRGRSRRPGRRGSLASLISEARAWLLDVGGVDDGQQPAAQPGADDVVQDVEGVRRGGLVVLVVGDQPAAEVAGDDLGRLEVARARRSTCRCRRRRRGATRPMLRDCRWSRRASVTAEHRHLGRRAQVGVDVADAAALDAVAVASRRPGRTSRRTRRGSTRSGGRGAACRPGPRRARCTRRWASSR